eukprot:4490400-Pleurochrysis_carterae.AAC.2
MRSTERISVQEVNSCVQAFAVAAPTRSAVVTSFEDTRATSKATTAEAMTATKTVTSDAIGASSKQLRRAAARTGTMKVQIEKASAWPASAKASATAEADATAEACVSIKRRNLRGTTAGMCEKQLGKMVMKTASSSMQSLRMCAWTDAASSSHDFMTIVAERAGVRGDVASS